MQSVKLAGGGFVNVAVSVAMSVAVAEDMSEVLLVRVLLSTHVKRFSGIPYA